MKKSKKPLPVSPEMDAKAALEQAKGRIAELERDRDELFKASATHMQERAQAFGKEFELTKAEKVLRIIGHINADRKLEAIKELMEPMPMVFGVQVKFADDKTRIAAENELLERVKQRVVDEVGRIQYARDAEEAK